MDRPRLPYPTLPASTGKGFPRPTAASAVSSAGGTPSVSTTRTARSLTNGRGFGFCPFTRSGFTFSPGGLLLPR